MAQEEDKLQDKLLDYIEDAHAMEQSVLRMLDSMVSTTDDPEIAEMFRHHKEETEQHNQRLRERLEALGRDPSALKEAPTIAGALAKGVADRMRGDKAAKRARKEEGGSIGEADHQLTREVGRRAVPRLRRRASVL